MNQGQEQFYHFFMSMVIKGKEEEAKELLMNGFKKQEEGTFNKAYLEEIIPVYFTLVRPECADDLKKAMNHFSQVLK